MTDQEIGISQVLPGPCCGRYVPEPEELERILAEVGIERTDQHPEFTLEPEEGFEYEEGDYEENDFDGFALLQGWATGWSSRGGPRASSRHTQVPPDAGASVRASR